MKHALAAFAIGVTLMGSANAQTPDPDPAVNNPDMVSWQLFALVNKSAPGLNNNAVFETWASNEDTFQTNPKFPGASGAPGCGQPLVAATPGGVQVAAITPVASPKILNVPALLALAPRLPGLQPHVVPGGSEDQPSEEVRRNPTAFNFIFCNKLFTKAGLRAAFAGGQPITFPMDSIEVKANWKPAGNRSPNEYHINTASDGKRYALVSMHIISKMLPNWTWATFEHKDNPGRCDFIGCHDKVGAVVQDVKAHDSPGGQYDPCVKTAALKKLFADAGLPSLWENYCLKGSQVDFVSATGVPTHLGNSIAENGFVDTASCITCHSRAAVNARAQATSSFGFLDPPPPGLCPDGTDAACSPNGVPNPAWFWSNPGQPDPTMLALQTDFVWSIVRFAVGP